MLESVLITGANAGLGKECARQLALQDGIEKVYLACRNEDKAKSARQDLEEATGTNVFEILLMDVTDLRSVRSAVDSLESPIDALVMNAGGTGGPNFNEITEDGVSRIVAVNLLGHVVLAEELLNAKKLTSMAIYAGSEAARGVPKLNVKRPKFNSLSTEEIVSILNGTFFGDNQDDMAAYGYVKCVAHLWMASIARNHPEIRFVTMSPGNTSGTEIARSLPRFKQFMFAKVAPKVMPLFGLMHDVEAGARRYVDALNDDSYKSGIFYASEASAITGPTVDQGTIFDVFYDQTAQENVNEAIHQFVI